MGNKGLNGQCCFIEINIFMYYIAIYAVLSHLDLSIIVALFGVKLINLTSYWCKVFDIYNVRRQFSNTAPRFFDSLVHTILRGDIQDLDHVYPAGTRDTSSSPRCWLRTAGTSPTPTPCTTRYHNTMYNKVPQHHVQQGTTTPFTTKYPNTMYNKVPQHHVQQGSTTPCTTRYPNTMYTSCTHFPPRPIDLVI